MTLSRDSTSPKRFQGSSRPKAPPCTVEDVARYSADLTLELRNLARMAGLQTLQNLLEIAYYEAYSAAHPVILPEGERERLAVLAKAADDSQPRVKSA